MVCKTVGQQGVGQHQAWYYLGRLNILQCMRLYRIHSKGAGTFLKRLKKLPDVIVRPKSFICHPWQLEKNANVACSCADQPGWVREPQTSHPYLSTVSSCHPVPHAPKTRMWSGKGGAGLPRANCLLKWKDWLYGLGESGWCNALWQDCRHSILLWKEGEVWQQTTTQHTGNWEDAKYPSDVNDATSSSSKLQAGVLWHCPKTALSSLSCSSHPDTS